MVGLKKVKKVEQKQKRKVVRKKKVSTPLDFKIEKGQEYRFEILDNVKEVMASGIVKVLEYDNELKKYWTVDRKGWNRYLFEEEIISPVKGG